MKKLVIFILLMIFSAILWAQPYTFSPVPQFSAEKMYEIWSPIIKALEKETGLKVQLVVEKDIPTFESHLHAKSYDISYMNPYHYLRAHYDNGYLPLVRSDSRKLSGILVVAKDSDITAVQQLDGKKLAFPAPNALGASLLMRAILSRNEKINIQPVYVRSHSSVYYNVALGLFPAGGGVMRTFNEENEEVRNRLRILYKTPEVYSHPIAVKPTMAENDRIKIQNFFINFDKTELGRKLLSSVPMINVVPASIEEYTELDKYQLEAFYVRS